MSLMQRGPLGQKVKPCVSEALRQSARMQTCTVRSPACNGRMDTTVLAHVRAFGNAGIGHKPHDFCAVYACHACHDAMDRRDAATAGLIGFEDLLRAMIETQARMYAAGLLMVEGSK